MRKNKSLLNLFVLIFVLLFNVNVVKASNFKDGQIVKGDKVWTIKFTGEIGYDDITKNEIKVINKTTNKKEEVTLKLTEDKQHILVSPPKNGYSDGEYEIFIGKNAHSNKNVKMKQDRKMKFIVKNDNVIDNKTDAEDNNKELTNEEIIGKNKESIVLIRTYDLEGVLLNEGQGVLISNDGKVLVNKELMKRCNKADIITHNGKIYNVEKVLSNKSMNYLVMQTNMENTSYVKINKNVQIGEKVTFARYNKVSYIFCNGIIKDNKYSYKVNRNLTSGFLMFDNKGNFIGISDCKLGETRDIICIIDDKILGNNVNRTLAKYNWCEKIETLEQLYDYLQNDEVRVNSIKDLLKVFPGEITIKTDRFGSPTLYVQGGVIENLNNSPVIVGVKFDNFDGKTTLMFKNVFLLEEYQRNNIVYMIKPLCNWSIQKEMDLHIKSGFDLSNMLFKLNRSDIIIKSFNKESKSYLNDYRMLSRSITRLHTIDVIDGQFVDNIILQSDDFIIE